MTTNKKRNRAGSKFRRRLSGVLAFGVALVGAGALYTALLPEPQTASAQGNPALVRQGEQLYNNACITCHGSNLQGVADRGPSLIGVGGAAVHFQVSTGRMPLVRQEAQAQRKPPEFSPQQIDALAAYVQAVGGGPRQPAEKGQALQGDDPARGGQLFRLNCASCHNFTGRGIALSAGKSAPALDSATEQQIYEAMLTGPSNMPTFSDRQLTQEEKEDIIAYVKSVTDGRNNPGGNALGGYGPGPETVVAWVVGLGSLIGLTLWIGARA
ncbi:menaquinol-cytochrome c reductase cytochrome c1 subunit precursor [Halopolyspora algeriensis]|uniref:Cytochrome bc1 complex cytochrome c subunit n=1 Tax=Halopolyspora algeriensis TaxID=1500506 RepID=A0A368VQD5_9ACTN|nr:cytochrome c [Halopolyspora algeriensis]RCW44059.1 menaquinol-cytochrome c reductase cytochrome c1 subunit precursor [Halopolyspora algeriensis]TQM53442.1 menaquinol-cytochrome c reductase cytochrome c1 subunit precursor [Halopolyspora algeriensis]